MKTDVVSVAAPARLHLGFLDLHGGLGRRFGSIGMAISDPATRIVLRAANGETTVEGPERTRARWHLDAMRSHLGIDHHHHHLVIREATPANAGLGSGTQIAIAIASALRTLNGMPLDPGGDADYLGRGSLSSVDAAFFLQGGVLVDGGKGGGDASPPVIARLAFPEAWRVILVLDPLRHGFNASADVDAAVTPSFPERDAADICRLVLLQVLPALSEGDIGTFGAAIGDIQRRIGAHFEPVQGGAFASPKVAATLARLRSFGAQGLGQSSWGPTGFAFAASQAEADAMVARLLKEGKLEKQDLRIVEGRNEGASIDLRKPLAGVG